MMNIQRQFDLRTLGYILDAAISLAGDQYRNRLPVISVADYDSLKLIRENLVKTKCRGEVAKIDGLNG